MVNEVGVNSFFFSQCLWATPWRGTNIGVMFAFTQFAGTHSCEADCRLIPVRSSCLGHLGKKKQTNKQNEIEMSGKSLLIQNN